MMVIAKLHEVVEIGGTSIDPVPHVVYVREFSVGAAGKPASLVAPSDFHALGINGVPTRSSEVEASSVGAIRRDKDLGVACEPPGDFS
jgi:hypothetical protein